MGHVYGYARVSTPEQDPALQTDALNAAGCERIFVDVASGRLATRPQFDELMKVLLPGDTLIVWKLDRLGRMVTQLLALVEELHTRGVEFRSLLDPVDTTTPAGRAFLAMIAAFAQMEREVLIERTQAGLAAARARGRVGGRKPKLTPDTIAKARRLYAARELTVVEIARILGVSRGTLYRYLDTSEV